MNIECLPNLFSKWQWIVIHIFYALLLLFSHSVVSDSFVTPWTVALQAPLSMGFSRQEYWSGLPCPPPGDLSNPRVKPRSPALIGGFFTNEPTGKLHFLQLYLQFLRSINLSLNCMYIYNFDTYDLQRFPKSLFQIT